MMTDIQKAMLGDKEAAERLTERGEMLPCPWCKENVFVYVHDDEGNAKGPIGCDYERDPWSGLSYGIHHFVEWGSCPLAREYYDDPMGGMLFDTPEEAIKYWNTYPQLLTKEQIEALERMEEMNLEEMTVDQLKAILERQKASETEAYQLFARCAGNRCAGYVRQFCEAGASIREIKQELRRRKNEKDS